MLSEISWMKFLSVTSLFVLFYYLWVFYSFYRAQKRSSTQPDGEPWPSTWSYPKPAYFEVREGGDDYQVMNEAVEVMDSVAVFSTQFGDYLGTLSDGPINFLDLRLQLATLVQADLRLKELSVRQQVNEIIMELGAQQGLRLEEELDLDAFWEGMT